MSRRFSISTLVPTLLGAPILAERQVDEAAQPPDPPTPDWLAELDDYEAADELSITLYGDLRDVLATRIDGPAGGRPVDRDPVRRSARVGCPRATRLRRRRRGCRKATR